MRLNDKIFASTAYLFGVPALYLVLTEHKKEPYLGFHGQQAFQLWVWFFVIFFTLRFFINFIWSFFYIPYLEKMEVLASLIMGGYAIYCAYRSFKGEKFIIPK